MARVGKNRIIGHDGRRRLTRSEKVGIGSLATLVGVAILGLVVGVVIDRLMDFDDALDAGGEWDEGGGVFTRWNDPV